jgi:hypothetical protein
MEAEYWLSPSEAALSLGISGQYTRKLMRQGKLTHIWTSLGRLIDPSSIEEFRASWERRARYKPSGND